MGYVSRLATTKAVVSTVMITISRAVSGHPAKAARMVRLISFIVVTVRLTSFLGLWRAEMVPSAELRHAVGWAFLLDHARARERVNEGAALLVAAFADFRVRVSRSFFAFAWAAARAVEE